MPFEPLPLNVETLTSLLNEGSERPGLDYKRVCDLKSNGEKVELAKDLGAMQILGGYIVIGADDHGEPSGQVTDAHAKHYDQAVLHAKMAKYLADGFEVRSTALTLDEQRFGLICVLPHPDGWAPFKSDGFYKDGQNKDRQAFRAGDVFTRRGSSSEPWSQADVRHIRAELRRQEREIARGELQADYLALQGASAQTLQVANAPAAALNWGLDDDVLGSAIVEQLRAGDEIPLISLLKATPRDAVALLTSGEPSQFDALLDNLTCVIARLITIERHALAERSIGTLGAIYDATFTHDGRTRTDLGVHAAEVHLAVVGRALALGALATREKQWSLVRSLATRSIAAHDADYWATWLFHGEVSAARANLLRDENQPRTGRNPLVVAQEHIVRLDCLRPDVEADSESVTTSLCQFDMLAAFATLSLPIGKDHDGSFLANFASWFSHRTDPTVVALINGGEMRETIFPADDEQLAQAIRVIAANASRMAGFINGWDGYEAEPITRFLQAHPQPAT